MKDDDDICQIGNKTQGSYLARARAAAKKLEKQYAKPQRQDDLESKLGADRDDTIPDVNPDGKGALAVAVNDRRKDESNIYLFKQGADPVVIARRADVCWGLCVHDDKLYDAGTGGYVHLTADKNILWKVGDRILGLCAYEGRLYHAGTSGFISPLGLGQSFKNNNHAVNALCSYEGDLYAGDEDHKVWSVTSSAVRLYDKSVFALCVHDGQLYDSRASPSVVSATFGKETIYTDRIINGLCSHNGVLYDCGEYKKSTRRRQANLHSIF